jgi:hypothetical protein
VLAVEARACLETPGDEIVDLGLHFDLIHAVILGNRQSRW